MANDLRRHLSKSVTAHYKQIHQMKFKLLLLILLVSKIAYSQSKKLSDDKIAHINHVIALFKERNIEKISNIVSFSLKREYPIPGIKNVKDLKQRFSEVFDEVLFDKIANSKPEQWSEVGWRGIMLGDGVV